MSRPLVLLSNDDGFASLGLRELRLAFQPHADVVVAAPETEQSAASHALTLHRPLRTRAVEEGVFAVDGTPADCVYIALHSGTVLPRMPDLVVSGVNHGPNLGQDVFYSGTVAAAREGALRGIPALAVSAHPKADFAAAARLAAQLSLLLLKNGPASSAKAAPKDRAWAPLLNLNVPKGHTGELVGTRLGARYYDEVVDVRTDPRGRDYSWIGGPGVFHDETPGTDTAAYHEGKASLSALILDLSNLAGAPLVEAILRALP
ncbi:MAG: 5'/3'-nucleotidase SurE [Myxococcales bacterium]|nr:5'/3'-nucleotidase SurE [Myxococcales bacterium]